MFPRDTIVIATTVFTVDSAGGHDAVAAELRYDAADPYAVTVTFLVEPGERQRWTFGRDLLVAGLTGESGHGDVRIRRGVDDPALVVLELRSFAGHATVTGVAAELAASLRRSFAVEIGRAHV